MKSTATNVKEYLASMPEDRREAISAVREVILKHLPKGYEEGMQYGMIGYYVPHSIYPKGYHCNPKEPLPFINLGNQKNHLALYMNFMYGNELRDQFEADCLAAGKKVDMGQACLRFKKTEDLVLEAIGKSVAAVPADAYIARIEAFLADHEAAKKAKRAAKAR